MINRRSFITGIKSFRLTNKEIKFLVKYKPWGIILFSRNLKSLNQIKKLTNKIKKIFKDKKTILLGMPGAFTSVCSSKHLPGYLSNLDRFKSKGIDLIACIAVNDPFVMSAWGKQNNVDGNILMLGDPFITFTKL